MAGASHTYCGGIGIVAVIVEGRTDTSLANVDGRTRHSPHFCLVSLSRHKNTPHFLSAALIVRRRYSMQIADNAAFIIQITN